MGSLSFKKINLGQQNLVIFTEQTIRFVVVKKY